MASFDWLAILRNNLHRYGEANVISYFFKGFPAQPVSSNINQPSLKWLNLVTIAETNSYNKTFSCGVDFWTFQSSHSSVPELSYSL
jgi:hypothetical protein